MDTKIDFGDEYMQRSIRSMIVTNLALLGADGETLRKIKPPFNGTEGVPVEEISAIAERVGADPYLSRQSAHGVTPYPQTKCSNT